MIYETIQSKRDLRQFISRDRIVSGTPPPFVNKGMDKVARLAKSNC